MGSNAQEVKIKSFDAVEHHGAAKKFDVGTCKKKDRKLSLHKQSHHEFIATDFDGIKCTGSQNKRF